jgi:hypothetical protein
MSYSDDVVIPYLLQVYGDTVRHKEGLIKNGFTESTVNIHLTNLLHGIGHCIRWTTKQLDSKHNSISDSIFAQKLAADFSSWGLGYHMIAQEFVAWSRKVKQAQKKLHCQ